MSEPLILDRYRLLERLAAGGSAEVWRARDEQLDREVAVKRLHPHLVPDDPSRKRLVAEARAAAGLSHPVIVGIYDVDATGESPALVMELVDGESLAARLTRSGPLPARDAAAMAADVAEALFHAHQQGVIHRDVKPGNVLLASDGRTRLVDFGIAHSLAPAAERLTLDGTVVGTLHAMAPEQLAAGPITPRTDLYGVGVVLYEALTGRPPYDERSAVALADAQRAGPPSFAGIDPALAAIISACLAVDPVDRPLHAGAVAEALRYWLAGDPAAALTLGPVAAAPVLDTGAVTQPRPAVTAAPAPPQGRPPSAVDAAEPRSSNRRSAGARWLPALLLLALAALGVAALVAFVNAETPAPGADASPSATPAETPAPTEPPWLADVVAAVERDCGEEIAAEFRTDARNLAEEEARDAARQLRDGCKKQKGGGNGGGNGNGNGNGNGGPGGGDD